MDRQQRTCWRCLAWELALQTSCTLLVGLLVSTHLCVHAHVEQAALLLPLLVVVADIGCETPANMKVNVVSSVGQAHTHVWEAVSHHGNNDVQHPELAAGCALLRCSSLVARLHSPVPAGDDLLAARELELGTAQRLRGLMHTGDTATRLSWGTASDV